MPCYWGRSYSVLALPVYSCSCQQFTFSRQDLLAQSSHESFMYYITTNLP